jgi:thiol-disulfide isomerase/thioredoxin
MACLVSLMCVNLAGAAAVKGPAPNFTLKSMSGKNLKLSEMAGNVVLINFWASWCGPCREEMPYLNALHKKYAPLGFTVLGVNVEEQLDGAMGFLSNVPVDFPILLDSKNKVVVDRDGNMRYLHEGYKPGDEKKYRQMVKKLVRE